jgi:hypothetical protein
MANNVDLGAGLLLVITDTIEKGVDDIKNDSQKLGLHCLGLATMLIESLRLIYNNGSGYGNREIGQLELLVGTIVNTMNSPNSINSLTGIYSQIASFATIILLKLKSNIMKGVTKQHKPYFPFGGPAGPIGWPNTPLPTGPYIPGYPQAMFDPNFLDKPLVSYGVNEPKAPKIGFLAEPGTTDSLGPLFMY